MKCLKYLKVCKSNRFPSLALKKLVHDNSKIILEIYKKYFNIPINKLNALINKLSGNSSEIVFFFLTDTLVFFCSLYGNLVNFNSPTVLV